MTSWADKAYWAKADDIAYSMYRQLFSVIEKRGKTISSFTFNNDLSFDFDGFDSQICVDIIHNVLTCDKAKFVDNVAACLAEADFSEIEITTLVPKYSRISRLKKDKYFQWDLINVIRHELEHTLQGCNLSVAIPSLKEYPRSENNFLLDPCEIPAYVHGFRISTCSRKHFLKTITAFIKNHNQYLNLSEKEENFTIKTWYNYLKNLKYYSKIQNTGEDNE